MVEVVPGGMRGAWPFSFKEFGAIFLFVQRSKVSLLRRHQKNFGETELKSRSIR